LQKQLGSAEKKLEAAEATWMALQEKLDQSDGTLEG
jgi:hypothetical protein